MRYIKSERHQRSLEYAFQVIMNWTMLSYVEEILLYGSCVRQEEGYSSNVNLMLVLKNEYREVNIMPRPFMLLQSEVCPGAGLPEVWLRYMYLDTRQKPYDSFYRMIKREAVSIWKKEEEL